MNLRNTHKPPQPYRIGTKDVPVKGPSQGPACTSAARKVGGRSLERTASLQASVLRCQESETPPAPLPCGEQESARGTPRIPLKKLLLTFVRFKLQLHLTLARFRPIDIGPLHFSAQCVVDPWQKSKRKNTKPNNSPNNIGYFISRGILQVFGFVPIFNVGPDEKTPNNNANNSIYENKTDTENKKIPERNHFPRARQE